MDIRTETKRIEDRLYEICKPTYIVPFPKECEYDIDVCIWSIPETRKWTIATLKWDYKQGEYYLKSCGMRLAEYGNQQLLWWLLDIADKYTEQIYDAED